MSVTTSLQTCDQEASRLEPKSLSARSWPSARASAWPTTIEPNWTHWIVVAPTAV